MTNTKNFIILTRNSVVHIWAPRELDDDDDDNNNNKNNDNNNTNNTNNNDDK